VPRVIDDWPKSRLHKSSKVPTLITYDERGSVSAWGFSAESTPAPLTGFKLLLENWTEHKFYLAYRESKFVRDFKENCPAGKTEDIVASDYLHCLWDYTITDIKRDRGQDFMDQFSLRVTLGVPAMWSPTAKERMRGIAIKAGLPSDVTLVSEPEAAVLAVMEAYDGTLEVRDL